MVKVEHIRIPLSKTSCGGWSSQTVRPIDSCSRSDCFPVLHRFAYRHALVSSISSRDISHTQGQLSLQRCIIAVEGSQKPPSVSNSGQTQLMLRSLALNTGILEGIPVNSSVKSTSRIASRYPIAPVATFLALLYTYAIVALAVVAWTCFFASDSVVVYLEGKEKAYSMLEMVQLRLTDPLAAVAEWFSNVNESPNSQLEWRDAGELGGQDSEEWRRTLETDALNLFDPDEQASVAPQISRDASGNIQFSLRKRYAKLSAVDDWQ